MWLRTQDCDRLVCCVNIYVTGTPHTKFQIIGIDCNGKSFEIEEYEFRDEAIAALDRIYRNIKNPNW